MSLAATAKTFGLFGVLVLLFAIVGAVVGNVYVFLAISVILNAVVYFTCDRMVLRAYRGRVVTEAEAPGLHRAVERAAHAAGMPKPRVAIVPSMTPNAFATGRDPEHALVAATEGILRLLDERELTAVLAHEMAHVKNRDILVSTLAATFAGVITSVAHMAGWFALAGRDKGNVLSIVLVTLFAAFAATLVRFAISRTRELKADETGARDLRDPLALAAALRKLEAGNRRQPMEFGNEAAAGLFIVNPLRTSAVARLLSTHPPMEERVRRLERLASEL